MTSVIGFLAGFLTTIAFLPQVIRTWRRKTAKDLSYSMLFSFTTGVVLWFVYGILTGQWPLILTNGVTALLGVTNLGLKIHYDGLWSSHRSEHKAAA
jgi:MtN3 and saliva related transmembrane protein